MNDLRKKCEPLLKLLKLNDVPADEILTDSQVEIFHDLIFRPSNREQIICSTQYGKSRVVAMACMIITCIQKEVVSVVAPTNDKAKIIMRYYVEHLSDNILFYSQLEKDTKLERLRQEESKERIILRNGGGIFVVSVQAGNTRKRIEAAMGLGSKIVIGDENCLVPDDSEASIYRMIAAHKDGFYCKIGNPFYNTPPYTHFWQSWNDSNYKKIFIDYQIGLKESRYTQEFIEEARKKPHFDILFECKFPTGSITEGKWTQLISRKEVEDALVGDEIVMFGEKSVGIDPADTGVCESVIVLRGANVAEIRYANANVDLMEFTGQCILTFKTEKIRSNNRFADAIGVGAGLISRVREQGEPINPVNSQETAADQKTFVNKRAEAYWKLRDWLKRGGKLRRDERWFQLCNIYYKADDSTGRMRIMSKDIMASKSIPSPDAADALMMTFVLGMRVFAPSIEEREFKEMIKRKKMRQEGIKRKRLFV